MQLALDTVCSCFPDHYAIRQYGYIRNTLLAYPVLYEESYTWKENLLYIARTDILPKTNLPENMSLICVSRRLPKEWADSNNHIILLLNDTTVFSAFNTVFAIFQDFQNWERRLLTELEKTMILISRLFYGWEKKNCRIPFLCRILPCESF